MDEGQLPSWSELLDLSSKDHTEQSCALNVDFLKYIHVHCVVVRPIAKHLEDMPDLTAIYKAVRYGIAAEGPSVSVHPGISWCQ